MFVYSYQPYSESARQLAKAVGGKRIRHNNSKFRGRPNKLVLNWGASALPDEVLRCRILNHPEAVAEVANKDQFFDVLGETDLVPDSTRDAAVALEWVNQGHTICCRTVLNGHSGQGLVLARTADELVNAPLYTKYIKKSEEYRVHVWGREPIGIQRKVRKPGVEPKNWQVRSRANGFIYQRNDLNPPQQLESVALEVFDSFALDFGAVDCIYNAKQDKVYALEINTAPGLEPTSVGAYAQALKSRNP